MNARIKVRGVYSTAITRLLLDWEYVVVDPSSKIRERFGLDFPEGLHDILICDRDDLQGIEIVGSAERLCQFITFIQERLLDAVVIQLAPEDDNDSLLRGRIEFPGCSKETLDSLRVAVTPTLARHHRLRAIDPKTVERAEIDLQDHPDRKESLERRLLEETILLPLEKCGIVRLEHIRPSGKVARFREGMLIESSEDRIVFRRSFSDGRYDGLDVPIHHGDYGLTELQEGSWVVKHSYFTRQGKPIGEYFNINTPVELYPFGARYLDLEVDVIRRADEAPFMVDREKLALLAQNGAIGPALEQKALEVAEGLLKSLSH
jgi:Protein of unknown function (DUF402)